MVEAILVALLAGLLALANVIAWPVAFVPSRRWRIRWMRRRRRFFSQLIASPFCTGDVDRFVRTHQQEERASVGAETELRTSTAYPSTRTV